jgi:hypothetical protein
MQNIPVPHEAPFMSGVPGAQVWLAPQVSVPLQGFMSSQWSRCGSPATHVNVQSFSQPSPAVWLPSSHSSLPSTLAFPQTEPLVDDDVCPPPEPALPPVLTLGPPPQLTPDEMASAPSAAAQANQGARLVIDPARMTKAFLRATEAPVVAMLLRRGARAALGSPRRLRLFDGHCPQLVDAHQARPFPTPAGREIVDRE